MPTVTYPVIYPTVIYCGDVMDVMPLRNDEGFKYFVRFSVRLYSRDYERFKSLAVKVFESELWSVLVGDFSCEHEHVGELHVSED